MTDFFFFNNFFTSRAGLIVCLHACCLCGCCASMRKVSCFSDDSTAIECWILKECVGWLPMSIPVLASVRTAVLLK